jgi:drug/metabolite transporter (DMT)-like permease
MARPGMTPDLGGRRHVHVEGHRNRAVSALAARFSPQARAGLWMSLTAVTFALSLVAIRALAPKFSAAEILFFRAFVGVGLMAPFLARSGIAALGAAPPWLYFVNGLAACVGIGTWNWAVPRMPLADATALNFTLPLFTVLLAIVLLGERVGARRLTVTLFGFAGVLVILRPGFVEIGLPALVALGCPAAFSAGVIVIKMLQRGAPPGAVNFNTHVVMTVIALAASLATGWVPPAAEDLPWAFALGLLGALSYLGLVRALALADASVYAAFDFLRLPAATAVAVLVYAERPDAWTWAGAAIILAATWANSRLQAPAPRGIE